MYDNNVLSACVTAGTAACTAKVLPNTGVLTNSAVTIAVAVIAGLAVWGVMYARANR